MNYKYRCIQHGYEIRDVSVDDRDLQVCDCGAVMDRVFEVTNNIFIPERFNMEFGDLSPATEEGRQRRKNALPYKRLD